MRLATLPVNTSIPFTSVLAGFVAVLGGLCQLCRHYLAGCVCRRGHTRADCRLDDRTWLGHGRQYAGVNTVVPRTGADRWSTPGAALLATSLQGVS